MKQSTMAMFASRVWFGKDGLWSITISSGHQSISEVETKQPLGGTSQESLSRCYLSAQTERNSRNQTFPKRKKATRSLLKKNDHVGFNMIQNHFPRRNIKVLMK